MVQYFGGKATLAPWICANLPHHAQYVEPFCGSASVLLHKPRSRSEWLNDLNRFTINYLRWVQNDVVELVEAINRLRPDYEIGLPADCCTVEDAAEFYLYSQLSFMGGGTRWSTGASTNGTKINIGHLWQDSRRLQGVKITNLDAFDAIARVQDADTLMYVDPPYLGSVRKSKDSRTANPKESMPRRQYAHEFLSEEEHRRLGRLLIKSPAMVVLSGFASPLYAELFDVQGWKTVSRRANGGVEMLWLNHVAQKQLPQLALWEVVV